ncbi:hypothetical protein PG995_014017 [Apiospora arundinis]
MLSGIWLGPDIDNLISLRRFGLGRLLRCKDRGAFSPRRAPGECLSQVPTTKTLAATRAGTCSCLSLESRAETDFTDNVPVLSRSRVGMPIPETAICMQGVTPLSGRYLRRTFDTTECAMLPILAMPRSVSYEVEIGMAIFA